MIDILKKCFVGLLCLLAVGVAWSEVIMQGRVTEEKDFYFFESGWYQTDDTGAHRTLELPGKAPFHIQDPTTGDYLMSMEKVLPEEIIEHGYLCLRVPQQSVRLYVGEELRLEYDTTGIRLFGKNTDSKYLFVPLMERDAGQVLRVETKTTLENYSGVFRDLYYGTQAGIIGHALRGNGFTMLVILTILLFGMVTVILSILGQIFLKRHFDIRYLGYFDVLIAMWLLFESNVVEFFFPNLMMLQTIPLLILMICTIPMALYINGQQKKRYAGIHSCLILLSIFILTVCSVLHICHIKDFYETMPIMAAGVCISIAVACYTFFRDIRSGYGKEMHQVIFGCLCCSAFGIIEMLNSFLNPGTALGGYLAAGMLIQLIFEMEKVVSTFFREEKERQVAISANQAKTNFLVKMSHDIRTPLNTILGMNEMILREDKPSEIQKYAQNIDNAGEYLLGLLTSLMDISQIESGNLILNPTDYDLRSMLHNLIIMTQNKLEKKAVTLQLDIDASMPTKMYGDPVRLEQIISNLLVNAAKYTDKGTVTFRVHREATEGGYLTMLVCVEDTGKGIRPEDMDRLFDVYERLDKEHNQKIEGYGLGLTIAKQLLQLMGSEMQVESEYEKGSKFYFRLIQRIAEDTPIGDIALEPLPNKRHQEIHFMAPNARILVVDDNEMNRLVAKKLLQTTSIQVDSVGSGEECLQAVTQQKYHLILMDAMMPQMSGEETFAALQKLEDSLCGDTPVIMVTANALTGARQHYMEEGFADYISKPIEPNQLKQILLRYIPEELQEKYSEISGIDIPTGLMYCGGSREIYREVMEVFHEMGESMLQRLQQLYESQDWQAYRIQVHSLKSSALNIGAKELSEKAKELEMAIKNKEIETVLNFHDKMMEDYKTLLGELRLYLRGTENE